MSTDALATAPPKIATPTPVAPSATARRFKHFWQSTIVIVVLLLVWEAACRTEIRQKDAKGVAQPGSLVRFNLSRNVSQNAAAATPPSEGGTVYKPLIAPQILPPPTAVFAKFVESIWPQEKFDPTKMKYAQWLVSGELIHDSISSMARVLVGFLIGGGLGLILGLAMGASDRVFKLMNPLMQILRPIPPIAYHSAVDPLVRPRQSARLVSHRTRRVFPRAHQHDRRRAQRRLHLYPRRAEPRRRSQDHVSARMIPAAMPYILAGMRMGIGMAFIVVIVSEMIAVNNGLGYRILEAREFLWATRSSRACSPLAFSASRSTSA